MASALRAVNFLEGLSYPHHPVFMRFPSLSYPVTENFLVELGGLLVPIHLDCDRNRSAHWNEYGCMNYFYASPGRWTNCYLYEAYVRGGMPYMEPSLPIIDEEYSEHVAVYQSILRARGSYVMAELGARWGTWGARAAAALAILNPMPYVLHFVESDPTYCRELSSVMALNNFSYSLDCEKASHEGLAKWILSQDHVDLLDLDVQGAEKDLMSDPALLEAIASKVYRLVVGTHSPEIHDEIVARFGSWIVIYNMPYTPDKQCIRQFLRGAHGEAGVDVAHVRKILERGCFNWSPWGRIPNWDGELIVDNPRFVAATRHFSMSDQELIVDELLE